MTVYKSAAISPDNFNAPDDGQTGPNMLCEI
jgi:hypothetical protein